MRERFVLLIAAMGMIAAAPAPLHGQTPDDFYDSNVLQDVHLTMAPADWATLKANYQLDTYYPADIQWNNITVKNIGVKSHGTGSRSGIKPALLLNINYYDATLRFLGMKGTILKNSAQDSSMLRDRLTMAIWRRLGLPAPRVNSARVYMNGDYIGVFENFETVDDNYTIRWLGESNGYLSKFIPFASGPYAQGYHFEYLGDQPENYAPVPYSPDNHVNAPDSVSLQGLTQVINQSPDATFPADIAPYLDLKLFAQYLAVEDTMGEWDGFLGDIFGMNNFEIYRFVNKSLFQILCYDEKDTFTKQDRELFHNASANMLAKRMINMPDVRAVWLETVMKILTLMGGNNGWVEQEITREYNQIRDAVYADPNKLVDDNGTFRVMTNDVFDFQVLGLTDWRKNRTPTVTSGAAAAGFQLSPTGPLQTAAGVVNAATNSGTVLAPGSLVTIYGSRLASATAQAPSVHLPGSLGGTAVYVNGFAAPLMLVSSGQVNFQMPWEIGTGPATVTMIVNGTLGNTVTVNVGPFSPGIFAVTHADSSPVTASSPATAGEVLLLYSNGLGAVSPAVATGEPATTLTTTTTAPTVTVGGATGAVQFSGLSGFAGLYQVNVKMPATLTAGTTTPLVMSIGGQSTTVNIATR